MQDFFYVKDGCTHIQVLFSELQYIEAEDKYVMIMTTKGKHMLLQSLQIVEKALPSEFFCRIHRSYIISLAHTKWFDHNTAFVGGRKLPIGKHYKGILPRRVLIFNNEPKPYIKLSDFDVLSLTRKIKPN